MADSSDRSNPSGRSRSLPVTDTPVTMRRIYESDAIHRDQSDPFTPKTNGAERAESRSTSASNSAIDWGNLSHAILPLGIRDRAIAVDIEANRDVYTGGESVHFRVVLRNRLPFPVTLRTQTPVLWSWAVDGLDRASRVTEFEPPDRAGVLSFARSETKVFTRTWPRRIRESAERWESVVPGRYTLSAWINVENARNRGLFAETSVRIE